MRIAIVCNDTRGGVQPYVALGLGLAQSGHEVRIVAPANYSRLVMSSGLQLFPLSSPPQEEIDAATRIAEKGTLAIMAFMAKQMPKMIFQATRETLDACHGVDLITGGVGGMVTGVSVADKLGVPFVQAHLQPVAAPSADYPGVMLGALPGWIGNWGRLLSHYLSEQLLWMPFRGAMSAARAQVLGLDKNSRALLDQPIFYGFSRRVVEVPGANHCKRHTTGYWTLPLSNWNPPGALLDFLAERKPVLSCGFGSLSSARAEFFTRLVIEAAEEAGARVVLLTGAGGLSKMENTPNLYCIDEVPHEWLFSRVSAIVHHGGAGTTAAALRSGVPNIVVPFGVDQPFWGSRVAALGVGPQPIPHSRLSAGNLSMAVRKAITDGTMREKSAELGSLLQDEDGVAEAVKCFNALVTEV